MTHPTPDKENSQIAESAEIENIPGFKQVRLLGQGGMGSVYLAEELALSRKVALKVLHPQNNAASHSASILEEARTLAQVNHPNVVQVYSVLEQPVSAIVMEYVAGTTLKKYQLERPLELLQKVNLLYQIAQGLEAIHQHGIEHRDIKADNILIDQTGNQPIAKLADFGISSRSVEEQTTGQNKAKGSLSWMSPEQLQLQDVNASSDMFSFGLLAFHLLAEKHPFDSRTGQSSSDIAENIVNKKAMDARDIIPALPEELAQLINQLLHKSQENRPGSKQTSDRLQQIERMLQQRHMLVQDTQTLETGPVKKKSNKLVALAAVIIPLLLLTFYWYSQQEPETRYVAVLKPKLNETEPLSTLQKSLVLTSIEDALQQLIINTPNLMLIPQSELNEGQLDIAEIGLSTGADDIVTTELTCSDQSCEMVLSLQSKSGDIDNPKWHTINRLQHPIYLEYYQGVFQFTQTQFANLYKDISELNIKSAAINEKDYTKYLELHYLIYNDGQYNNSSLEKIEGLINNNIYFYHLYSLYFDTALDIYYQNNDQKVIERAQTLFESVPSELKQSTDYLVDGFYLAMGTNDYESANHILEKIEKSNIAVTELYLLKGTYFQFTQQFDKAVEEYSKLLKLRPSALIYYNLALTYWWKGEQELAIKNLEMAKSLNSFISKVNSLLGAIYLQSGMLQKAIKVYSETSIQSPDGYSYTNLAVAYLLNKEYPKAVSSAENALQLTPLNTARILNYADSLYLSGDKNAAKLAYKKILTLSEGKSELTDLTRVAQAYLHLGEKTKALKVINEAKEIAPNNPNVLYISAMILVQLKEIQSALLNIEKAIENGMGEVWFYLPWFDSLCEHQEFINLTTLDATTVVERCESL